MYYVAKKHSQRCSQIYPDSLKTYCKKSFAYLVQILSYFMEIVFCMTLTGIVASRNAFTNCTCINNGCQKSRFLFQNYVTDVLHQLSYNLAELNYAALMLNIQKLL